MTTLAQRIALDIRTLLEAGNDEKTSFLQVPRDLLHSCLQHVENLDNGSQSSANQAQQASAGASSGKAIDSQIVKPSAWATRELRYKVELTEIRSVTERQKAEITSLTEELSLLRSGHAIPVLQAKIKELDQQVHALLKIKAQQEQEILSLTANCAALNPQLIDLNMMAVANKNMSSLLTTSSSSFVSSSAPSASSIRRHTMAHTSSSSSAAAAAGGVAQQLISAAAADTAAVASGSVVVEHLSVKRGKEVFQRAVNQQVTSVSAGGSTSSLSATASATASALRSMDSCSRRSFSSAGGSAADDLQQQLQDLEGDVNPASTQLPGETSYLPTNYIMASPAPSTDIMAVLPSLEHARFLDIQDTASPAVNADGVLRIPGAASSDVPAPKPQLPDMYTDLLDLDVLSEAAVPAVSDTQQTSQHTIRNQTSQIISDSDLMLSTLSTLEDQQRAEALEIIDQKDVVAVSSEEQERAEALEIHREENEVAGSSEEPYQQVVAAIPSEASHQEVAGSSEEPLLHGMLMQDDMHVTTRASEVEGHETLTSDEHPAAVVLMHMPTDECLDIRGVSDVPSSGGADYQSKQVEDAGRMERSHPLIGMEDDILTTGNAVITAFREAADVLREDDVSVCVGEQTGTGADVAMPDRISAPEDEVQAAMLALVQAAAAAEGAEADEQQLVSVVASSAAGSSSDGPAVLLDIISKELNIDDIHANRLDGSDHDNLPPVPLLRHVTAVPHCNGLEVDDMMSHESGERERCERTYDIIMAAGRVKASLSSYSEREEASHLRPSRTDEIQMFGAAAAVAERGSVTVTAVPEGPTQAELQLQVEINMLAGKLSVYEATLDQLRITVEEADMQKQLLQEQNLQLAERLAEMQAFLAYKVQSTKTAGASMGPWLKSHRTRPATVTIASEASSTTSATHSSRS
ncbi:hypothetical protein CEUSTIGMA_g11736.t1 [Chlamydomonas eustigma]|uniref:Uncharacterized protein n=1 Tax=Chlamydomonas eustigma TaxID=1157962 RepID=A0A250XMK1_9CHLO|nr:hypothetical protein CEUSTIGMA_g11736.t1 [Chlamydomonas eustigma]|eukprot:GAX84314.1 hypothetical protein CEUSTIGMA_g11736.t1 [Chlamydomonas eustigma]